MNDSHDFKLTDLDYLTGDHHVQMLKAALPYISVPQQRMLSIILKAEELERTVLLFHDPEIAKVGICSLHKNSPTEMLSAIRAYGNTKEQEFIDMMINLMKAKSISFSKESPLEQLKNFLSPEQQAKIEQLQIIIQALNI